MAERAEAKWTDKGYKVKDLGVVPISVMTDALLSRHKTRTNATITLEFKNKRIVSADLADKPEPPPTSQSAPRSGSGRPSTGGSPAPAVASAGRSGSSRKPEFRNPYNFLPIRDRLGTKGPLGDGSPPGFERFVPEAISGWIDIELTTVTPMIVNDAVIDGIESVQMMTGTKQHVTFTARRSADGNAMIPPASLRGALSSLYEAATNSRFRELNDYSAATSFRQPPEIDPDIKPVIIRSKGTGWEAEICERVKVDFYVNDTQLTKLGAKWQNSHGATVHAQIESPKGVKYVRSLSSSPSPGSTAGTLHVTHRGIAGKKYENVFIRAKNERRRISDEVRNRWTQLITDYRKIAADDGVPEGSEIPAHALPAAPGSPDLWLELRDGMTAYALIDNNQVKQLFPSRFSRELAAHSPAQFLPSANKRAAVVGEMSPADRLFGWVPDGSPDAAAHPRRGALRLTAICQNEGPGIVSKPTIMPILSSPKPAQGRFYLGQGSESWSRAQPAGIPKREANYSLPESQIVRGRKTYPTQRSVSGDVAAWQTQVDNRSDQNWSVSRWVAPDTKFQTRLWVHNVAPAELGALLWLLNQPAGCIRVGGAKPFGFGAVRVTMKPDHGLQLGSGHAARYQSWGTSNVDASVVNGAIDAFKAASEAAFNATFEDLAHIKAIRTAMVGYNDDLPTHYPRESAAYSRESFEWFSRNDSVKDRRFALGNIADDPGLPFWPKDPPKQPGKPGGNRPGGGQPGRGGAPGGKPFQRK